MLFFHSSRVFWSPPGFPGVLVTGAGPGECRAPKFQFALVGKHLGVDFCTMDNLDVRARFPVDRL